MEQFCICLPGADSLLVTSKDECSTCQVILLKLVLILNWKEKRSFWPLCVGSPFSLVEKERRRLHCEAFLIHSAQKNL